MSPSSLSAITFATLLTLRSSSLRWYSWNILRCSSTWEATWTCVAQQAQLLAWPILWALMTHPLLNDSLLFIRQLPLIKLLEEVVSPGGKHIMEIRFCAWPGGWSHASSAIC